MNIPFKINYNGDNDYEIIKDGVKTGIFILKNLISDHDKKCFIDAIDKYSFSDPGTGREVLKCSTCLMRHIEDSTTREKIKNKLDSILSLVVNRVSKYSACQPDSYECVEMRKIHGPTQLHIDGLFAGLSVPEYAPNNLRCLSVVIAINGNYKGGEFIFPSQNVEIKLKAGEAILFPPYWTHPHGTNDVHDTFRYTITSWFTGASVISIL